MKIQASFVKDGKRLLSMKIKGKEWMDWLHKSRADVERRRKESKQTVARYLKNIEEKSFPPPRKHLRPPEKRAK